MHTCMTCNQKMARNTFVCNSCERAPRVESASHNTHLVREQHCREIVTKPGSADNEGSQYWDHAQSHQSTNEDSELIEHDQANPDFVSAERIVYIENLNSPSFDITEALELIKVLPKELLSKREVQAVRDFANGKTQRQTAKKLKMSVFTANAALKSGLEKLKEHVELNTLAD